MYHPNSGLALIKKESGVCGKLIKGKPELLPLTRSDVNICNNMGLILSTDAVLS